MPTNTLRLTFTLEGDIELKDLVQALHALSNLLDAIAADIAPGVQIRWTFEGGQLAKTRERE